jgi:hypothetical protein
MKNAGLTAKEFLDAYFILSENNEKTHQEIAKDHPLNVSPRSMSRLKSGNLKRTIIPNIVCLVFSLELYLKELYQALSGKESERVHKIAELFSQLPCQKTKDFIIEACGVSNADFDQNLHAISDAFVKWRYAHEYGSVSFMPEFSLKLTQAVKQAIENIKTNEKKQAC